MLAARVRFSWIPGFCRAPVLIIFVHKGEM
jgi:hypothetical protein